MAKQPEILFKGMTRPAMLYGVPIYPLILVISIFALVSVWTNIIYMFFVIPVILVMKFIVMQDDYMFNLLFQSFKTKTPTLNKKYYGVKSYSSMEYRKMNKNVGFPTLSILGLDSNPTFEKFIPFSSLIKKDIVLTKDFNLVSSWKIQGISFEVESDENQDFIKILLANVFQSFSSEPVSFYFHSTRFDIDTDLKAKYDNSYLQEINDLYYLSFSKGNSKSTDLYLTMIYNPFLNNLEKSKFLSSSPEKSRKELLNYISKFHDYSNRLEANLSKFVAKKLKIYEKEGKTFSTQLELYNYLLGGKFQKVRALNTPVSEYLIGSLKNIQFSNDLVQLNYIDGTKKFAQLIEIKDYTSITFTGILDILMYLDVNYTLTQSFTPMQRNKAKEKLKKQKKHFKSTDDDSITQEAEFDIALDRLTNGDLCFGNYHFSLSVFGETIEETKSNTNKVITCLQDIGLQVILADIALPSSYFSQIPCNFGLRPRVSPVTNENFASLIALHNFAKGRKKNNQWGDAITILKTPSKQIYYFNIHAEKSKNDFGEFTLGNFLVLGQSGGGKTAMLQFLNNQLLKFANKETFPKNIPDNLKKMTLVYLDKDYGAKGNILSAGGRYINIQNGLETGFNPFMIENTKNNKRNLQILMKILVTANGEVLKTSEEKELANAIDFIMDFIPLSKRKYGISLLLENLTDDNTDENSLKQRFSLWKKGAKYGWVFDNENDLLDFPDDINIFGIDGTEFLNDPDVSAPLSFYILWRVTNLIDGRRFGLIADEFWQWFANLLIQEEIFNKLKTIRKENGFIGMASQSVEDVLKLKIARAIVEQTSTHIFFPNEKANKDDYVEGLSCTEEEFNIIKNFNTGMYPFLIKRGKEAAIVTLDLSTLGKENISIISTGIVHVEKVDEIFNRNDISLEEKVNELRNYYKNI
ncbi:VirB3 family type IV secretion system protein [Arcobacter defluvii]|uniref:P-type type IV conjugative transfer system protein, fused VirB3/VirB4 (TrbDE) n=1 Tax=Arcobacter defluvii TaxID=873191 RepID=A0AAE7E7F6_9BACT|nr:VirB3 family type IV secretion system protein [Arcobacter defluvii]QKF77303.1 P-type type IV conjugative transfer system protein, fused VirB3/VirB4 (TrbDE) [Arcobacter defluvii]QKF77853.1 P-type type IV conjugative transfer system protein, fused VirB3/VirB4 (TrbDE) [Arcobacter defluvii]RXI29645.1 type IV secretion system protein VirB4 [Arcobacter defluvii]